MTRLVLQTVLIYTLNNSYNIQIFGTTYTACVDSYKYESDKNNLVHHCRNCTTSNVSYWISELGYFYLFACRLRDQIRSDESAIEIRRSRQFAFWLFG